MAPDKYSTSSLLSGGTRRESAEMLTESFASVLKAAMICSGVSLSAVISVLRTGEREGEERERETDEKHTERLSQHGHHRHGPSCQASNAKPDTGALSLSACPCLLNAHVRDPLLLRDGCASAGDLGDELDQRGVVAHGDRHRGQGGLELKLVKGTVVVLRGSNRHMRQQREEQNKECGE